MSWVCPRCERELKSENQMHYCAKVNLDDLFKGKSIELMLLFDKLLAEVADWPDVLVSTTPNCISFMRNKTFFLIRPMQKQLDLKFYSRKQMQDAIITKSNLYGSKFENHVRLSNADELRPQLFSWIRESYEML